LELFCRTLMNVSLISVRCSKPLYTAD